MCRKFTKKIRPFGMVKKVIWVFKNHDFFLKKLKKNLEKNYQKFNFDVEKTLLNEKVAKIQKVTRFRSKVQKKYFWMHCWPKNADLRCFQRFQRWWPHFMFLRWPYPKYQTGQNYDNNYMRKASVKQSQFGVIYKN